MKFSLFVLFLSLSPLTHFTKQFSLWNYIKYEIWSNFKPIGLGIFNEDFRRDDWNQS